MMISSRRRSNVFPKSLRMFWISVVSFSLCGLTSSKLSCCSALETKDDYYGSSTKPKKTAVRRENNLDHWDSDTLAYYLDEYPGYDLAIMFYASWDEYSHKLAPYWNQIAHILGAGTTKSKLIMSLFDCELNTAHMELCKSVSITHYPTLMFIGSGPFHDTDPITRTLLGRKSSAGMMGESPVPNTIKFQGNWQLPDSILDWIYTMQALSRWHTWSTKGFGKRLRNFFIREKIQNKQLPLGVPNGRVAAEAPVSSNSASSSSIIDDNKIKDLEQQVDKLKNATKDITKVALRTATMLESVLLVKENSTDMFTLLDERAAWTDMKSTASIDDIYRFCVMEVSLDYCQRVNDAVGTNVVDKLLSSNLSSDELLDASTNMETLILDEVKKEEPFCGILDKCIDDGMRDDSCRPKICPFLNENACRYTTACMDSSVVVDYAEALKIDADLLVGSSSSSNKADDATTTSTPTTNNEEKKKISGWGF